MMQLSVIFFLHHTICYHSCKTKINHPNNGPNLWSGVGTGANFSLDSSSTRGVARCRDCRPGAGKMERFRTKTEQSSSMLPSQETTNKLIFLCPPSMFYISILKVPDQFFSCSQMMCNIHLICFSNGFNDLSISLKSIRIFTDELEMSLYPRIPK